MELLAEIVLRPLGYAALVALVFVPLEKLVPMREARRGSLRADVLFATVGGVVTRCGLFVVAGVTLALADGLGGDGLLRGVPAVVAIPIGLLYFELAGYAYHRLAHAVPALWRLHEVHHTSETMDWLAGFRQHPLEIALMTLVQNLPLVLVGLPLGEHALVVLLLSVNTLFVHSNVRTPGWLAHVIATPTFHHRHHDRDARTANYATLFPWIDRAFGTRASEPSDRFGVADARLAPTFLGLMLGPFRARR